MKKFVKVGVMCAVVGFAGATKAIQPPVVIQPKPAIINFSWTIPTTRTDANGTTYPLAASELKECRLYLTNETEYIAVPTPTATYTYVVPFDYTTKATDTAVAACVDTAGRLSALSNVRALPVGVTSPKPLVSAPGALNAVQVQN